MKNIIKKALPTLLFVCTLLFGNFFLLNFTSPAFAIPNQTSPTTSEQTNPDQPEKEDREEAKTDKTETEEKSEAETETETETTPDVPDAIIDEGGHTVIPDVLPDPRVDPVVDPAEEKNACKEQTGGLYWVICPTTQVISKATDAVYSAINDFLVVQPIRMEDNSPIYTIWKYARSLTNIIFAILLTIVIYSQITGLGISNYGVKRILPRLIITVILINLSYIICALAIDVSNIAGQSLRGALTGIKDSMMSAAGGIGDVGDISFASVVTALLSGGTIAGLTLSAVGGLGSLFWMLVVTLLGAIVSVVTGLITIAGRQAIVALLVMVSPLAFIAYLLPNTERLFTRWKNLLIQMLIFFPAFSFLFGASQLIGWALMAAATSPLGIVLGLAVQVFPLFFSWSLMKMSGTILGTINAGLRRLAAPIQRSATGWSLEKAQQSRQHYLAHSNASGAKLRRYLDYRRELRGLDTKNSMAVRHNRAAQRAYTRAASITGRDKNGNMTWSASPNRYTVNAKTAAYTNTLASTAELAHRNTLSAYGRHFAENSPQAKLLTAEHGQAFENAMAQQYLAVNEAEADQAALLDKYLISYKNRYRNPYDFNRLIKDSGGNLGHRGEASIMGQVIANSAMIEDRRKREATIMATKFGIDKMKFRAMAYNMASISDDGKETDENGTEIEDSEYRIKINPKTGHPYQRRQWQYYIGVHKTTGKEIEKDEYDALSTEQRKSYNKVNYFDILDDQGDPVQRVYDDDAGYMKVLLRNDIQIGDPINRRYAITTGLAHTDTEDTGLLRRYHSTISAAIQETKYAEHAAGFTSMLAAQVDRGFITSKGQLNIAEIQSFTASGKAGKLTRNDGTNLIELAEHLSAITDDDAFARFFPDQDILTYRNVNGVELDGWRLVTDEATGERSWQEINHNDPTITLEDKKNLLRYKMLPKCAAKVINSLDRKLSPAILEDLKPDGLKGLNVLIDKIQKVAIDQAAQAESSTEKPIEGTINIFDSQNPDELSRRVKKIKKDLTPPNNDGGDDNGGGNDGNNNPPDPDSGDDHTPPNDGGSGGNGGPGNNGNGGSPNSDQATQSSSSSSSSTSQKSSRSSANPHRRNSIDQLNQRNQRLQAQRQQYYDRNSYSTIKGIIDGYFAFTTDYETIADELINYFQQTEVLQDHVSDCQNAIENHRYSDRPTSTEDAILQNTQDDTAERIAALYDDIIDIIDQADTY